jgi:hypothetical protein
MNGSHEIYLSSSLKNDCIVVCFCFFLLEAVPACLDLVLAFRLSDDDEDDGGGGEQDSLLAEAFWEKARKTFFMAVEMPIDAISAEASHLKPW